MALFTKKNGETEALKQLQNEVKSLEFRKNTILSSFDTEIAELSRKKNQEFLAAGTKAYELYKSGMDSNQVIKEYWNRVDEINVKIQEKEAKKKEMEEKYNEELVLLQASSGIKASLACPKCGYGVSENDGFCEKCGNRLK